MARVMVRGIVVYRREFPPKDDRKAQVSVSIVDGQRYSLFAPMSDPIAAVAVGDMVEVVGDLSQRDQYLNIQDAELKAIGKVTWSAVGAA